MCCRKLSTFILSLSKVHGNPSLGSFGWSTSIKVPWKNFPQTYFLAMIPLSSHKVVETVKLNQ